MCLHSTWEAVTEFYSFTAHCFPEEMDAVEEWGSNKVSLFQFHSVLGLKKSKQKGNIIEIVVWSSARSKSEELQFLKSVTLYY